MPAFNRVSRMVAAAATATALAVPAAPASAFHPQAPECIAPANPGGGWDFTCREVGRIMQEIGVVDGAVRTTNLGGGGGGAAYAEVVAKRHADDNLIVAASSVTVTRLAQNAYPGHTMDDVRWIGSVGADYGIVAVAEHSAIETLPELLDKIRKDPQSVSIGGGSAVGGWDHLKVLFAAKRAGIEDLRPIKYVAFGGAAEAAEQLVAGSVQAFSADASEAKNLVESGGIRVIAVLAPQRLDGEYADVPTAREQGVDVVGANWLGFYAPGGMSAEAYAFWTAAIDAVQASAEWKAVRAQKGLAPLDLGGEKFQGFVARSIASITGLSKEVGLIE